MTNETNRRAVMGGAIAAGAAGATAVLPAAANSGPQLSAIDRKVIDLEGLREALSKALVSERSLSLTRLARASPQAQGALLREVQAFDTLLERLALLPLPGLLTLPQETGNSS